MLYNITLHTRLANTETVTVEVQAPANALDEKVKKQARIQVSTTHASDTLGFLHAAMIMIGDRYFLLAGPSGVGKTTLAENLGQEVRIIANDWVAVEKEGDVFYASDVNYADKFAHNSRCRLSGIFFLTQSDGLRRDAFVPSPEQYDSLLAELFDAMPVSSARHLSKFWTQNREALPFYCVIPTRDRPVEYVARTFMLLLQRMQPRDSLLEVGVIGVGAVGVMLASELGHVPMVDRVHLYNRSRQAVAGLALDLNQALYGGKNDLYIAHDTVEDLFRRASVVFITFRDKAAQDIQHDEPERWRRVVSHAAAIRQYADIAARVGFTGTVFVITNPVDFLTYAYYQTSQDMSGTPQRSFQVYGIGLEGDMARAIFYGRQYLPSLATSDIALYGNHADEVQFQAPLSEEQLSLLADQVSGASSEVRSHDIRTVFGPVAAAMRTFQAYLHDGETHVSLVQSDAFMGCRASFRFGLPSVDSDVTQSAAYGLLMTKNKKKIAQYQYLL